MPLAQPLSHISELLNTDSMIHALYHLILHLVALQNLLIRLLCMILWNHRIELTVIQNNLCVV